MGIIHLRSSLIKLTVILTRTSENAMGSPAFKQYHMNPSYEIEVSATMRIMSVVQLLHVFARFELYNFLERLRLQLVEPSSTTTLNVSLFPAPAPSSASTPPALHSDVVSSGPYVNFTSGVATPQVPVQPGKYIAILSTSEPGIQRAFRLVVYSTAAGLKISPVERR